jgi:acetoin utilization protein AcuB
MLLNVSDVALQTAITVQSTAPISEVENRLIQNPVSRIYVTDEEERLLGVVPDHDILSYRLLGGDGQGRIGTLMIPPSVTITPSTRLSDAIRLLCQKEIDCLPVVTGERLIGQLCRSQLFRLLHEQNWQLPRESTEPVLTPLAVVGGPSLEPVRESLRLRIA